MSETMKKFVILIDMDDTIEKLVSAWICHLNSKFGTNVKLDDIVSWDITQFFPSIPSKEVYAPLSEDEFWKTVEPRLDAMKYIPQLIADGHRCYIVTTSSYLTIKKKMESVLFRSFPCFAWRDVIIAYNKQMIIGDYLIDDGVHNLIGGKYKKILMTMPHNKNYDAEANDMTRVDSWDEVYDIITRDSKKQ